MLHPSRIVLIERVEARPFEGSYVHIEDGLRTEWTIVEGDLRAGNLVVFPIALSLEMDLPKLYWPDDDWAAFLEMVKQLGTSLLYGDAHELCEEDLEEWVDSIDALEDGTNALSRLNALRRHLGSVSEFEVGFVSEGIHHLFTKTAGWWTEAEHWLEELAAEAGDDGLEDGEDWDETERHYSLTAKGKVLYAEAKAEQLHIQIARDPGVRRAADRDGERAAAIELLSATRDLTDADWEAVVTHLVGDAYQEWHHGTVKDDLEQEVLEQIDDLLEQLMSEHEDWATVTVGIREGYARSFLKRRFGHSIPVVVKKLARKKL